MEAFLIQHPDIPDEFSHHTQRERERERERDTHIHIHTERDTDTHTVMGSLLNRDQVEKVSGM